jgi:NitT/TauT family transport system substrate-binding protein
VGIVETAGGGEMIMLRHLLAVFVVWASLAAAPVRAETDTVRIAMPYGLGYLPAYVVVDRQLIQKHAAAAGLGDIKVTLRNMASGPVTSDMILANDADIGMGGWGPAFIMWDKTSGTQKVRGIMPLSGGPIVMLSNDPRIQSLKDFREGDKIGISAIKVTDQAVTLQMAAVKEWGWDQRFRLDPLTVSISNPDGMAAILSGQTEMRNHFTIVPFSVLEEESGKVHRVFTSDDYMTPGSSGSVMYCSARFHDPNPKLYAAVAAAFEEAFTVIAQDPKGAAQIYVNHEPQKHDLDWVMNIIKDPKQISYSSTPRGIKEHADFMYKLGTLKHQPESWKEMFWENAWDHPGAN